MSRRAIFLFLFTLFAAPTLSACMPTAHDLKEWVISPYTIVEVDEGEEAEDEEEDGEDISRAGDGEEPSEEPAAPDRRLVSD